MLEISTRLDKDGDIMRKAMPIGIDDFAEMINENYYFVDKTKFIEQLREERAKVTLITRPRRFGKTLNLSMLSYFFDIDNAVENKKLFKGLYIESIEYMQEQGTRPVIFLTLKDIKSNSWENQEKKIANNLSELFQQYLFLSDSPKLSKYDKVYFEDVCSQKSNNINLEESLVKLCKMLALYYEKKPILLIDEYDTPIISAWHYHFYDKCIQFMRNLFGSALKNNRYLDFAVLTGITRVSKESIFSGLNNLDVCGVTSDSYADCFGFTHLEAEKLMQDCGYAVKLSELQQWYDGYKFGNVEIYNPWSVINFVRNKCEFKPYWINVSENAILRDVLTNVDERRYKELKMLLNGGNVETMLNENILYSDLGSNRDALFMMLLHTGYLKAVNIVHCPNDISMISMKIPNREIRLAYNQEVMQYIVPKQGLSLLQEMFFAMINGNSKEFEKKLSQVLLDIVSYHDTAEPESFYHGLLLGFSVLMTGVYRIESNRESGYGRFDIALFPSNNANAGVILELKAAKSDEELTEMAKKAIKQINDKSYCIELKRQSVTQIWKYGISFYGKKVHIECEK